MERWRLTMNKDDVAEEITAKHKRINRRMIIAAIPLILVNSVAFAGQFSFIRVHIHWPLYGQLAFALGLESIALYLAFMAHEALMAEDSAYGLRILSYLFGGIIGLMNYSHYAGPGMQPTFEAVATGLMSVSSPFLWGIYSRRNSRDALKAKGLMDARAVKLGALRWILWNREARKVFRLSVWRGTNNPILAIKDWEESEAQADRTRAEAIAQAETQPSALSIDAARTKAEAVRAALAELGEGVAARAVVEWLAVHGWTVTPPHVRAIRSQSGRNGGATIISLPNPAPEDPEAVDQ
jgi:hypothetical protein